MDLRPSHLAELFHMNERALSIQFKHHVGVSLNAYINLLRITQAEELLQAKVTKLKELAKLTGFTDSEHFITCFKKYSGENPRKYRERYLQK